MVDSIERNFVVTHEGEAVPCVLWTPGGSVESHPLVIVGHGFTQHKRALFPPSLVNDLVARGLAVASIDAPGHGDRQPDGGRDRRASERAWREHWRQFGAERIAAEHSTIIDELLPMPDVTAPIGYWGLSLATQYGVGVLSREPRIVAAVLGLSALPEPGPRIAAYAEAATCPVFFIQQLDDEIAKRDASAALFDRLGTSDKTLRASPGRHMDVPRAVFEEAYDFIGERLRM